MKKVLLIDTTYIKLTFLFNIYFKNYAQKYWLCHSRLLFFEEFSLFLSIEVQEKLKKMVMTCSHFNPSTKLRITSFVAGQLWEISSLKFSRLLRSYKCQYATRAACVQGSISSRKWFILKWAFLQMAPFTSGPRKVWETQGNLQGSLIYIMAYLTVNMDLPFLQVFHKLIIPL